MTDMRSELEALVSRLETNIEAYSKEWKPSVHEVLMENIKAIAKDFRALLARPETPSAPDAPWFCPDCGTVLGSQGYHGDRVVMFCKTCDFQHEIARKAWLKSGEYATRTPSQKGDAL